MMEVLVALKMDTNVIALIDQIVHTHINIQFESTNGILLVFIDFNSLPIEFFFVASLE